jgi:hypothetical protein
MLIELLFPFYDGEFIIWASVCKEWRNFLLSNSKITNVTKLHNIYHNLNIFKWSRCVGKCLLAVKYGSIEIVKYMIRNKYYISKQSYYDAFLYGDVEIIKLLYKKFKYCHVDHFMIGGCKIRKFSHLKWLWEKFPQFHNEIIKKVVRTDIKTLEWTFKEYEKIPNNQKSGEICDEAAKIGNFEKLKLAMEYGYPIFFHTFHHIAKMGLEALELTELFFRGCNISPLVYTVAAKNGDLKMMKWAQAHGCHWVSAADETAAMCGNLEILQWIYENNYEWSPKVCDISAHHGQFETLKWLHAKGCAISKRTCTAATRGGHFDILMWLRANGCNWDKSVCDTLAEKNNFDMLKWAKASGCPMSSDTFCQAAKNGNFEMLKWLYANECEVTSQLCEHIVAHGNIEIINWMIKTFIIVSVELCVIAAEGGNLEILKMLREVGCGWDIQVCIGAAWYGNLDVLQWSMENGCPYDCRLYRYAAVENRLEIIKFIYNFGVSWNQGSDNFPWFHETIHMGISNKNYELVRWVAERGCPFDLNYCVSLLLLHEEVELSEFLKKLKNPHKFPTLSTRS